MPKAKKDPEQNYGIPCGLDHLSLVLTAGTHTRVETQTRLASNASDLQLIGSCLCALYQAATCHRKCHKGPHILESLCARAYNQACAAYNLILLGYYDEALSLIRGIGEIYHLVALSTVDRETLAGWLKADRTTRIREFGPGRIRSKLRAIAPELELTDPSWYPDLSERFTHVTPTLSPNKHNPNQARAGGMYQQAGLKLTLDELTNICCGLAMLVCRYFDFSDLFSEITQRIRAASQSAKIGS